MKMDVKKSPWVNNSAGKKASIHMGTENAPVLTPFDQNIDPITRNQHYRSSNQNSSTSGFQNPLKQNLGSIDNLD